MASVTQDKKTGGWIIQFVGDDGKRPKIRLGKVNKRQAESAKRFTEDLISCKVAGTSPRGTTSEWLAGLPDIIRKRLELLGLIGPRNHRECPMLGDWLDSYIKSRSDVKAGTVTNFKQVMVNLIDFFGKDKLLSDITPGDAEDFRIYLKTDRGLSEGTIRRRCKRGRQFLAAACKKKILDENPFADMKCGNYSNPKRYYFVSIEDAQAVLDACPNAEWRLLFALCRYGGLRCPSEVLRLQWDDIEWGRDRFIVHASKTEHHADGGIRQVPIFPELYPYLRDGFEQAEAGQVYVINRYRDTNSNLRTQLGRIIKRAGLVPWPKLFQNLRSTRETELMNMGHPEHAVCKWIGNSLEVAKKHYLQTTEADYEKAVQKAVHNPVSQVSATSCMELQQESGNDVNLAGCETMRNAASPCKSKDLQRLTPRRLELRLPG